MSSLRAPRKREWTPLEDAKLRQLARQGLTITEIAKRMAGRSRPSVDNRRRNLGLYPTSRNSTLRQIVPTTCRPEHEIVAQINRVAERRRACYALLNGLLFDDHRRGRLLDEIADAETTLSRLYAEYRLARSEEGVRVA